MEATAERVLNVADVQTLVREGQARLIPRGGGSKPALCAEHAGAVAVAMDALHGISEYNPSEYTITALAGTPLRTVIAALAEHGQYLPFDPPLADQGATLGGALAAGLSGPRRWRYGGLRDFLLGIRFVDGRGRLVQGGGKVVKNAAGFDIPKLFAGSLGRLGIITEATFKVFPNPPAFATLRVPCATPAAAQAQLVRIATTPLELEAADVTFDADAPVLWLRIGGLAAALPERLARLRAFAGGGSAIDAAEDEAAFWRAQTTFAWAPAACALAKVPMTPQRLLDVDAQLAAAGAQRVYSVGGHVAWVAWPQSVTDLDAWLRRSDLAGLLLRGAADSPLLGKRTGATTLERVKAALDPNRRFLEY